MDVEILKELECRAGDETRKDGIPETDVRIGHVHVEGCEEQAAQGIRRQFDEDFHRRAEHHEIRIVLCDGSQEYGKAAADDDQDGQKKEDADIVRYLTVNGPLVFHVPNAVQGDLDVGGQLDDSVQQ